MLDHNMPLPPNADKLDVLNPYAVLLRYDFIELKGIDRDSAYGLVAAVREWAENQIG